MKLSCLAEKIGAILKGDADTEIVGVASLDSAAEGQVSFLNNRKYLRTLLNSNASAVVIEQGLANSNFAKDQNLLLVDNPDIAFSKVVELFSPPQLSYPSGISDSACVSEDAEVSESAYIGPMCVVERGAKIGENSVLVSGVYIGVDSQVGSECILYSNSVIREYCILGDRVILHPCAVIGADGFGFQTRGGVHEKIPQRGNVIIEDDVEIGACTCVDRARFASTVIGVGTKLDNLVQVAHNVKVGRGVLMASQVGIAGTCKVGDYVMMGGQSGIADHCDVGEKTVILARAGVSKDLPPGIVAGGFPALPHTEFIKREMGIRKVPALQQKIKNLEERLNKLEAQNEHNKS